MDLLKHLDEKLIAELIPEVSPHIIFMSYYNRKKIIQKRKNQIRAQIQKLT